MNSSETPEDPSRCGYQENLNLLRTIDFFSVIPLDMLKVVALLCTRETFKQEEFLFRQGDNDGQAFYIISGGVEILRGSDNMVSIRTYGPKDFIGSLSLLGPMRRLFSARLTAETSCLTLSRDKFEKAMRQFPTLLPKVVRTLIQRIQTWEERIIYEEGQKGEGIGGLRVGVTLL